MGVAGYWRWNFFKNEGTCSDNFYNMFEWDKGKELNFDIYVKNIHPDDVNFFIKKIEDVTINKKNLSFSHRFLLEGGRIKTVYVEGQALTNKKGEVVEIMGTAQEKTEKETSRSIDSAQDTTDYRLCKEILKKRNQLLNFTEQIIKIGFWSWKPGDNSIFCSENLCHILGKSKNEELISDWYFNCIHPDDFEYVKETIETSIKNLKFQNFSHRIICDSGTLKTIQIIGEITSNLEGKHIELNGTCIDITESESKTAEIKLKNQQLRIAEKMAMIGSWHWDFKTNEIKWSDNLYAIYGHKKTDLISLEAYKNYIHDDDKDYLNSIFEETLRTKQFVNSTHKIQLKDGSVKVLNSIGKVLTNKNGDILEIIGVCQDITKSKADELELLQKNQSLSFAEEITKIGNWKWEVETNEYEWSDNLYKIVGFEIGETITKQKYLSRIPVEDKNVWIKHVDESLENKKFEKLIHRINKPDNTVITLEVNGKVLTDEKGEITAIFGTSQDITERKQKELQLIEKNHFLNLAQELAMVGYWRLDLITEKVEWTDNLYKIHDIELGTPLDLQKTLTRVHPDDLELIEKLHEKHSETNKFEKFTHRTKHRDGTIRTIEVAGQVIKDENNKPIEYIGTSQDVTERIEKELALTEKNQQLILAEEIAMIGCWVFNIESQIFDWSDNTYRIFDFDIGIPMDMKTLFTHIPEEEHENLHVMIEKFKETKVFDKITHSLRRKDGSLRVIEVVGKVITNEEDKAVEFIGSSRDITDELRVKQEILDANKNLEQSAIKLSARNRQLAEFNQISSHNLRAPVGNLSTLLNLYNESKDENERKEIFSKFGTVIERLSLTLDTLVESLKIKNSPDQVLEDLVFNDVLNKTKDVLSAEVLKTGAIIKSDFKDKESLQYNQIYLESIFLNLIGNAIKYSSPERTPEINITSNIIDEKVTLIIKDNGLGIDLEKHGHKLFGLNKVFHRHPEAQGIGLFLTKAQIETMGGTIYAESEVNIGTTFFITLN